MTHAFEQHSACVTACEHTPSPIPQSPLRTALAGLIGNVLEWFDFAVYGYFATQIGSQFFPQVSAAAQQLLAFRCSPLGSSRDPWAVWCWGWSGTGLVAGHCSRSQ